MTTTIDREKECPFLLRIFTRNNGHHSLNEFSVNSVPASDELQLYTWRNATLEELGQLIQEVIPEAQHPDARIAFRLIYLENQRGVYRSRDLGRVMNIKPTPDQSKTLEDCQFLIGDYLDVAIFIGPPPVRPMGRRGSDWGRDRPRDRRGDRFGGGGGGGDRFSGGARRDRDGRDRDGRFRRDDRAFGGGRRDRF